MVKTIYTISIDCNSHTSENLAHALRPAHLGNARLYVVIIRSVWNGKSYDTTTLGYSGRIGGMEGLIVFGQATVKERETIARWVRSTKSEV